MNDQPSYVSEVSEVPSQSRTPNRANQWIRALIFLMYLGVSVVLWPLYQQTIQGSVLIIYVIFVVILLLLLYLVIAIHELGHVIAGKLIGFRLYYITIGPLKIERRRQKIVVGRIPTRSMPGGLAGMIPPDSRNLRRRVATMIAGGPAATLLLTGVAGAVFMASLGPRPTIPALILLSICLLSFIQLPAEMLWMLVPVFSGGFTSDGRTILELLRCGPWAEHMCASLAITAASYSGTRPRDWNSDLVQQTTLLPEESLRYYNSMSIAYYHALDCHQVDEAGVWIDQIADKLPHIPTAFRANFQLEVAYFEAHYRHNAALAQKYLNDMRGGIQIDQATLSRVESSVLLAEGQTEAARTKAEEGLAALDLMTDIGSQKMEMDLLQDIIDVSRATVPES